MSKRLPFYCLRVKEPFVNYRDYDHALTREEKELAKKIAKVLVNMPPFKGMVSYPTSIGQS